MATQTARRRTTGPGSPFSTADKVATEYRKLEKRIKKVWETTKTVTTMGVGAILASNVYDVDWFPFW